MSRQTFDGGWIGVDLDGTLATYTGTTAEIGPPVPAMVLRVKHWLSLGIEVRIVTARVAASGLIGDNGAVDDDEFAAFQTALIRLWCEEHLGQALVATAAKDFMMAELWDDRAVRVEHDTGRVCSEDACVGGERFGTEPA